MTWYTQSWQHGSWIVVRAVVWNSAQETRAESFSPSSQDCQPSSAGCWCGSGSFAHILSRHLFNCVSDTARRLTAHPQTPGADAALPHLFPPVCLSRSFYFLFSSYLISHLCQSSHAMCIFYGKGFEWVLQGLRAQNMTLQHQIPTLMSRWIANSYLKYVASKTELLISAPLIFKAFSSQS